MRVLSAGDNLMQDLDALQPLAGACPNLQARLWGLCVFAFGINANMGMHACSAGACPYRP
jgi:hypothetical protein